jgi:3-oxoadipate enol-lactonase
MRVALNGYGQFFETIGHRIPLLCLPPFPFDHTFYREQFPLHDSARLILPDYRGTGRSELTPGPYTMDLLAGDMCALLDHLKVPHAVVLGSSMGVYVALAMYALAPERVLGLVLADSRAEADTPEMAERRQHTVAGLRAQGPKVLGERVQDLFGATTRRRAPDLVQAMQSDILRHPAEGLAQLTLGLARRPDRNPLLPGIKVPTAVVCGEEDTVSPPAVMRTMAEAIPGAVFQLIPQAGHLSPLEQPALFNQLVRDFLAQWPLDG